MPSRRRSKKRDAILSLIKSSMNHPGAQWVYEQLKPKFPDLSLGTVYRNIKILYEEGALSSAGVINNEERFDGLAKPHSHIICSCCGKITDLDETISSDLSKIIQKNISGFSIDIRKTMFYGLCNRCSETTALGR